jgi:hypothetical protein
VGMSALLPKAMNPIPDEMLPSVQDRRMLSIRAHRYPNGLFSSARVIQRVDRSQPRGQPKRAIESTGVNPMTKQGSSKGTTEVKPKGNQCQPTNRQESIQGSLKDHPKERPKSNQRAIQGWSVNRQESIQRPLNDQSKSQPKSTQSPISQQSKNQQTLIQRQSKTSQRVNRSQLNDQSKAVHESTEGYPMVDRDEPKSQPKSTQRSTKINRRSTRVDSMLVSWEIRSVQNSTRLK